ncbi:Glutamate or tyrosine decarboxylase [Rhizobiales bacterium GAS191]|nr:Glutamate or tyrosine decarboxylase [Rhizobiales bacterium GAS113]SEB97540.1 Glutamate or tyrosine decarboxylase [Rhizobiales bacterium GAS188]SED25455.1 Glutamate or tyrosine decarboxylase [Rhizobiales bacterium GAS191]
MREKIRFEDAGRPRQAVMDELKRQHEGDVDWRGGRAPLYVFSATQEVQALGQAAFNEFFSENALGARRAFPSLMRMEGEVIAMGLDLFHGADAGAGNMTSGGTESIVMAIKAARDFHRKRRGEPLLRGNIVLPLSAHPAFDKGAALMDIEVRRVPLTDDLVADPALMEQACDADTLMLVGSVPCFSYGTIDPIAELAALASRKGIWLHVDACVGGWMAPFARDIGRKIPAFDFGVAGVMSLSADLHKFGFCPKPASTIFYREATLQACQEFVFDSWPSGRFATQTLVGTRPGGAVAAAWAVLRHLGRDGYRQIAAELMAMRDAYLEALLQIPGMQIRGKPALANIAFGCDDVDMGKVATLMGQRGWLPGMVRTPPSLHLMLSLHHAQAREAYVTDVAACIETARGGENVTATSASYA